MKFLSFLLLFVIAAGMSTQKRHKRKVPILANSADVQNITNCLDCRRIVKDSEGFITPVSNSTNFYELIYGWTIEVPMHHDILLTFSWNTEFSLNETSTCNSCKPYFEIIYEYLSSESTFKIDKFYNIRQLTNLSVPSHKTEIRFFSGAQCGESQKLENFKFAISFKAIPLEQSWGLYTLLSVLIPAAFVILAVAYFCVIMKKKEENHHQDVLSLPIPIYVDMDNPSGEFKNDPVKGKENRSRGLRLRSHHSSQLEEPKIITVLSSLIESENTESIACPEGHFTPDSTNQDPVLEADNKRQFVKKKPPSKVNLLHRYPRSTSSTPRYRSLYDEAFNEDRLSKSEDIIYEKRKFSREIDKKIFNFDVLPPKENPIIQPELETSVFLHSSSASSEGSNETARELPFVSPKKH